MEQNNRNMVFLKHFVYNTLEEITSQLRAVFLAGGRMYAYDSEDRIVNLEPSGSPDDWEEPISRYNIVVVDMGITPFGLDSQRSMIFTFSHDEGEGSQYHIDFKLEYN